jgi:hypothetical protein
MTPHPRIRQTAKWTATLAVAVLGIVVAISFFRHFGVHWWTQNMVDFEIKDGQAHWFEGFGASPYGNSTRWEWRRPFFKAPDWRFIPSWYHFGSGITVSVPLWFPLVALIVLATFLWHRDMLARRREQLRTSVCSSCGYDRAGLTAGLRCPECGSISD